MEFGSQVFGSSLAGLATITPAAGFVSLPSAVMIGIASGVVCYLAVNLKNRMGWDDALDVWGVHGIGGCLGTILLGVFAVPEFLQAAATPAHLAEAAFAWLDDPAACAALAARFDTMHHRLRRDTAQAATDAIEKILAR